jgi:hypothetical protein
MGKGRPVLAITATQTYDIKNVLIRGKRNERRVESTNGETASPSPS